MTLGTGGRRGLGVQLDHVLNEPQPVIHFERENGFRMKLNRLNGEIAMADAHDDAVFRFRGYFQVGWECFAIRIERMIAANPERRRKIAEYAAVFMSNFRALAVHGIAEHIELAAERFHNALQTETYAEGGRATVSQFTNQRRNTEIFRTTRTRGD